MTLPAYVIQARSEPSPVIEARVIAGLLFDVALLADAQALELDDFGVPANRALFEALRNVQAAGAPVDVPTILAELDRVDQAHGKDLAEKCTMHLAEIVERCPYANTDALALDLLELRNSADARRAIAADPVAHALALEASKPAPNPRAYLLGNESGFRDAPGRIHGERERRLDMAARALNYHVPFLDDVLRAILPHDLILLGAPTGLGKTELALAIATATVLKDLRVAYFALEAEPDELERRTKFQWLTRELQRRGHGSHELNYVDWYLGHCDELVPRELDQAANQWFLEHLGGLITYYRGQHFTAKDLTAAIGKVHHDVDLIVVDHLHYVDPDEDRDEHRALGDTVKTVRDVTLRIGKPIILVAHLRKADARLKQVVPGVDDFHGSSNITKICTQVITLARADGIDAPKWYLAPTFMAVLKDWRAGAMPLVALTMFDRRTRSYEETYTLGRLTKGRTAWEQLKPLERPSWARCYKQQELNL